MTLLFVACAVLPLGAQSHLYTWKADYVGQFFGTAIASAGDVNADGYDDVITGTGWNRAQTSTGDGARIFSGRDGKLLFSISMKDWGATAVASAGDLDRDGHADVAIVKFDPKARLFELWIVSGKQRRPIRKLALTGSSGIGNSDLVNAGDINKDGYPDLLVGDPQYRGGGGTRGRVTVVSGKDGSFLHDLKPTNINYNSFGSSVAGAGDVDSDGYADFLVGDYLFGSYSGIVGPGRAWLFSGKTGKVLWIFSRPITKANAGMGYGFSVCSPGDMDLDKVPDLAIGAFWSSVGALDAGEVDVFSGATGRRIRSYVGKTAGMGLGASLAAVGDWNRDGVPDLALGAPGVNSIVSRSGAAYIYSGKTSKQLASLQGHMKNQNLGWSLARGGDVDGDRRQDLLVGMMEIYRSNPSLVAEMSVWTPAKKSLWSDTHKVSLAKPSSQRLQLDAGAKHAGSTYFLLGSMSGIQPGLKLGALTLPLQVDPYFWLTATVPNAPFLKGSLGVLDSQGHARATFTAVTGMPKGLIGGRADHAYVVFGKAGFTMTSNWVPLLFEK